jgi:integrase
MSEWLVPGRFGKHRADLRNEWDAIRTAASLTDVNIHDLRRTFGLEATRTLGLNVASKLLRHSDPRITAHVYAPEEFPELRKATEAISKKRAAVLPFPASGQGR